MLDAALLAQDYCDAVDINLGCPQAIAKRGHYGAFLQDEWPLLTEIDMEKTLAYAKMLEKAGCQMLTVHGRTREQKGPLTGLANWNYVKEVRHAVKIPVISNGNIQCLSDVIRCLEETDAHGVMTAEGNLYNPALFADIRPAVWDIAIEYLKLVQEYPCPSSYIRGHLFKLFQHLLSLEENFNLRIKLGSASSLEDFLNVTEELKSTYMPFHEGQKPWLQNVENDTYNLILPPWLCQSYVRMAPEDHLKKVEEKIKEVEEGSTPKRHYEDSEGNQITRKRMKKLRRIMRRPEKINATQAKRGNDKCSNCANTLGYKCIYKLCKKCCRSKCYNEELDCAGHRILVKTRRQMAKHYASLRDDTENNIDNNCD